MDRARDSVKELTKARHMKHKPATSSKSAFSKLSGRHKQVVTLYLERGPCWYDKEKALIHAGYSSHTAKEQGARIFGRADVKAALDEAEQAIRSSALIDEAEYMELLCQMARDVACKDRVSAIKLLAQARGWDKPDAGAGEAVIPLAFGCDNKPAPAKTAAPPQDSAKTEAETGENREGGA